MEDWTPTPNSNGDVYRNLLFSTDRTLVETKQLQFLSIYDEHNALLGGTNMADLSWNGILWHYKDLSDFSRKKATSIQELDSGVCDAIYLSKNKFVCVGDSGAVQIYEMVQKNNHEQFQQLAYTCQHDDTILTVSMFANQRNIVTGGMDCCLKIWDVEDLIATYSYSFAHTNIITSTDVKPMCNSIFVSVSLDSESLLWDFRLHKPANCIFRKNNCPLSAVSWNTNLDQLIAIGTIDGSIVLIDTRNTETPLYELPGCDRSVHKLLFNPNSERKDQLACCCDNETVKIFDTYREMLQVYEDSSHDDFVRGLAWYKNDLYSCSWDANVIKHVVHIDN